MSMAERKQILIGGMVVFVATYIIPIFLKNKFAEYIKYLGIFLLFVAILWFIAGDIIMKKIGFKSKSEAKYENLTPEQIFETKKKEFDNKIYMKQKELQIKKQELGIKKMEAQIQRMQSKNGSSKQTDVLDNLKGFLK